MPNLLLYNLFDKAIFKLRCFLNGWMTTLLFLLFLFVENQLVYDIQKLFRCNFKKQIQPIWKTINLDETFPRSLSLSPSLFEKCCFVWNVAAWWRNSAQLGNVDKLCWLCCTIFHFPIDKSMNGSGLKIYSFWGVGNTLATWTKSRTTTRLPDDVCSTSRRVCRVVDSVCCCFMVSRCCGVVVIE